MTQFAGLARVRRLTWPIGRAWSLALLPFEIETTVNLALAPLPDLSAAKRHWLWPTRLRVYVGLVIAMAVWGWFDVRARGVVDRARPLAHKTDLTVYTEAGAACFDGREPYSVCNPRMWRYLYPPLFAMLLAPLHVLEPRNQVFVWFAISVVTAWGCYREWLKLGRALAPDGEEGLFGKLPNWVAIAALAASIVPALNCLQRGQVGVPLLYFMLLGARLIIEQRSAWRVVLGGAILAFPAAVKITPAVPLLMVLGTLLVADWKHRRAGGWWSHGAWATGGAAVGLAVYLLFAPAALVGWNKNLEFLNTWWHEVASRSESIDEDSFAGDSTTARNQSFTNAARRFGNWTYLMATGRGDPGKNKLSKAGQGLPMDSPTVDRVLLAVRLGAALLLVIAAIRAARVDDPLGLAAVFGLACVATLVIFTIARVHYFVLWLPAVTMVPLCLLERGHERLARWMAFSPVAMTMAHYVLMNQVGYIGLLGLATTTWYFAGCTMLLCTQPREAVAEGFTTLRLPQREEAPIRLRRAA